ncbi:MAG: hypothetical protein NTX52_04490 [Planctomycetota bacterium]|nr:hypothetical protein [Planctomycetota bacterium]
MSKQQIHKRLSKEQVSTILENYLSGEIKRRDACENLGVKKTRFFKLLSAYRDIDHDFDIKHKGNNGNRKISDKVEKAIKEELKSEKKLIDNKDIAIRSYNYSAVKELLEEKHKVKISLPTIISRAKSNGYYLDKPSKKIHDREVLTNLAGEMLQHDSSHHLWSPYMDKKLYLITTIDDYSRMILYAELVEEENVWAHISALKSVFLQYGCPLKYYADQHAIFRYVKDRDKQRPWNVYTKFTDDVVTQWKQVLLDCGVNVIYALSPEAKGKVERPYRWLQDRIVRTAAKDHVETIEGLRKILKELVYKYNCQWVHSTTKEIPIIRFENAIKDNKSIFKPFRLIKAGQTIDDIFCLRIQRVVDAYHKISLDSHEIKVPNGMPRQTVDLRIAPDSKKGLVKIRFWQKDYFLGEILEKRENLPTVHF